jgi:two-component system capsular synthesis response regulator RcsB
MTTHIVVADEHTIIRRGVVLMVKNLPEINPNFNHHNINIVGDAASPTELLNLLANNPVDILLLGFSLNTYKSQSPLTELEGITLIKWLSNKYPNLKTVVLSPYNNANVIRSALDSGASGYINHNTCEKVLERAITAMMNNETYIEKSLLNSLLQPATRGERELSSREVDVLRLLCKGLSPAAISRKLNLSNKTVSAHKLRAMEKLGVASDCHLFFLLSQTQMFDIAI